MVPSYVFLNIFTEPGYYEEGSFGIRLENEFQVVTTNTKVQILVTSF